MVSYTIVARDVKNAIPIKWTKIPEEILNKIGSEYLYTSYVFSSKTLEFKAVTVVYIKKISKSPKKATGFKLIEGDTEDNSVYLYL